MSFSNSKLSGGSGVLGECVTFGLWTQPCFAFVGEQFESDPDFRLAKSMLLDLFRGRLVENINLKVPTSLVFQDCHLAHSQCALHLVCLLQIFSIPCSAMSSHSWPAR